MHLEVRKEYQNLGIGTELVAAAESHLRRHGYGQVVLAVRTDNDKAMQLYRRLGYAEWDLGIVECRKDPNLHHAEPGEQEKCHVMTKVLTGSQLAIVTPHAASASATLVRLS